MGGKWYTYDSETIAKREKKKSTRTFQPGHLYNTYDSYSARGRKLQVYGIQYIMLHTEQRARYKTKYGDG